MKKIINQGAIWDLHIHTCCCPKGSSEFSQYEVDGFITSFLNTIKGYPDLQLISFTDHNVISLEVYQEYINKKGEVPFLVGIEIDTYFNKEEKIKHLIVYFDISKENFVDNLSFMQNLNSKINKKPIYIYDLLEFIVSNKIPFALSPHAFKQGNRGINIEWSDEDTVNSETKKYIDQFYCFWEAAGHSSIAKAIEFLESFELNDKVSIISFSDSNNFDKLRSCLNNPSQYFRALPTFRGLQMVATEKSRINKGLQKVSDDDFGNLIGKVIFDGEPIEFSDRLNAIIGGRGSGKSLLLDSIANKLKDDSLENGTRKEYIEKKNIEVYNFSGTEITRNNFLHDYFKQSFVSNLFNNVDYDQKIKKYFKDDFDEVKEIDFEIIKKENETIFKSYLNIYESKSLDNISNLMNKYSIIKDQSFSNSLQKKDISKIKNCKELNNDDFVTKMKKLIPNVLENDFEIETKILELNRLLINKIHEFNKDNIDTNIINNLMIEKYFEYKNGRNAKSKSRADVEELFRNTFDDKGLDIVKRVNIANSYLKANINFNNYYEEKKLIDGAEPEAFEIKNVLKIEKPIEFLLKKLNEYFYHKKLPNSNDENYLEKSLEYYCYSSDKATKDGKLLEDLDKDLCNYSLNYDYHPVISYKTENGYENIEELSPGTQTNVLMEYLVCKDTKKPLLIDQPEDNVDNYTIYNQLTEWFSNLKHRRQVIVVTHDANIVINADADNLILAQHDTKDSFHYTCGALEYKTNLDNASEILDGGKEAVKRRLMKYGE